jgi:NTE family protein
MLRADKHAAIGIALSSGGASSLAQVGVLEVLLEAGIRVRAVAGTSAGSIVAATVAAGRIAEFRAAVCKMSRRRVFGLFNLAWPRRGLLELRSALEFLSEFVPNDIDALAIPFAAVAADVLSGEEVVIRGGRVLDAVRASCSIPGIFSPCRRDGRWLVDGALVDPLPVNVVRDLGASFVIAINTLTVDAMQVDGVADSGRAATGSRLRSRIASRLGWEPTALGLSQTIANVAQTLDSPDDGPRLFKVVGQASRIVQSEIAAARLREQPADFLLNVPVGDIGSFDFHRAADLVERGRNAAEEALPKLGRAFAMPRLSSRRVRDWWRTTSRREPIASLRGIAATAG